MQSSQLSFNNSVTVPSPHISLRSEQVSSNFLDHQSFRNEILQILDDFKNSFGNELMEIKMDTAKNTNTISGILKSLAEKKA